MRKFIYILLIISTSSFAQNKYLTKTGSINFEASVPSFEEVAAKNNSVTAIINIENGKFAALAFVKAFRFKNALMEEHFNENYAESSDYPKAIFKGIISDFNLEKLEPETSYEISGELTFHGVSKTIENIVIKIIKNNDEIILSGSFKTTASNFDIKIPKIVSNKVSEDILISFNFKLKKK